MNMKLHHFQEFFFNIFILLTYILIFLSALGLSSHASTYLNEMGYYVRIYICLFLIWRFNPFRHITFTDLDRKIAFSAGLFILTTTALNSYVMRFENAAEKYYKEIKL